MTTTFQPITVALWGFGNQNKLVAKYLSQDKKMKIVAVISHHDIGTDYGLVDLGRWGKPLGKQGVNIVGEEDAAAALSSVRPQVCLLSTRSSLQDTSASLKICAESKVNVVTIAEELLDSRMTAPELTREMDRIFRDNGVTLTGSGCEDGNVCEVVRCLSHLMHKITAVDGYTKYDVDDYGKILAEEHGVGLTAAEFQSKYGADDNTQAVYICNVNDWLVSALGYTYVKTDVKREPLFASVPIASSAIQKLIPPGDCIGMKVRATTTTKEGVTFIGESIGKCYEEGVDKDEVSWGFEGEPSGVRYTMSSPPSPELTNTAAISRITQVIEAEPGYVPSCNLATPRYEQWKG